MGFFRPFRLERYFARHEFSARHLLCTSDCESFSVADILALEPGSRARLDELVLGYTESRGSPRLRADIAALYESVTSAGIIVHAGAEEAILDFCLAFLERGDRVIVNHPSYQSLAEIPRSLGCEVIPWRLRPDRERWTLNPDELKTLLTSGAKLVVLNMPHNPTGALMTRSEFDATIELCREAGVVLLVDEVYRFLEHDESDRLPAVGDAYENGVSINVLSKSWGLAGLRVGWIATRRTDILDAVATVKDYNSICISAPSEELAGIAVRNAKTIIGRNRGICAENTALFGDFFARHADFASWIPPRGGSVAFPKLNPSRLNGEAPDAETVAEKLLEDCGVLLLPGVHYDYDVAHFRIGLGRRQVRRGLEIMEDWLDRR